MLEGLVPCKLCEYFFFFFCFVIILIFILFYCVFSSISCQLVNLLYIERTSGSMYNNVRVSESFREYIYVRTSGLSIEVRYLYLFYNFIDI